jgi:peptidyl-prolyl cis-trans isomerase D
MFEGLRYSLKHNRKSVFRRVAGGFIFALIILVMGLWGLQKNGQMGMSQGTAATVNGSAIPMARLQEAIERLRRDPRMQQYEAMGGDFGQKMMQSQALSQVVEMELVRQRADKEHLLTTDAEVRDTVMQIPAFQEAGQFKREIYNNYLASTGKTGAEFEREIRNEQALRRTVELFRSALAPTQLEIDLEKGLKEKRANVEYLKISNDGLVNALTVRDQVKGFLAKPENERKVKDYFDAHKKDYSQQEQVKARHILIKSVDGDKDSENRAFTKAQDIEKQLKSGSDFGTLAKKYSDDPGSKEKGGDLGFFGRGSMVEAFDAAAFNAKVGTISEPVKTQFGYHIIQVEQKKPATIQTYEEVKSDIAQTIIARDDSHNQVANLEKALKSPDASSAIAKMVNEHHLKWEESGTFNLQAEEIPKVGSSDDAVRTAFTLSPAKPFADHLIRQGPNAFVIRYKAATADKEKKAAGPNPEDNPELVSAFAANRRSEEALRGWVETLRKSSKIVTSDAVAAGQLNGGGGSPFNDE